MSGMQPIKTYTAADIEKYHKGLLSSAEMHAMEKAALEDPLLADAIDGYSLPGVQVAADMADLQQRLEERISRKNETPVIPISSRSFPWMRAAVITGVMAGAALIAYFLLFNPQKQEIAQQSTKETKAPVKETKKEIVPAADSQTNSNTTAAKIKTEKGAAASTIIKSEAGSGSVTATQVKETAIPDDRADKPEKDAKKKEADLVIVNPPAPTPVTMDERKNTESVAVTTLSKSGQGLTKTIPEPAAKFNIFRGRVTDASNFGVPFAKVTNPVENVGTYTDARGYFNLTYPDSVLNVQVKSIGFENNNVTLRYQLPNNQVILKDDRQLNAFVISNQKPNNAQMKQRSFNNNVELTEPEPADGWENYDTYIANNIEIPDEYLGKPNLNATAVELSFEVDKNGQPVDIRVEKSLCDKCDKEAIRLVKEGPKWKQKALHGRTTVRIPFSQLF